MDENKNLPTVGEHWSEELIRKIAMDVGKEVVAYIEHAYPEAFDGVRSPKSFKLSIRNATYNSLMSSIKAAREGRIDELMASRDRHRREMRRLQRAAGRNV